MRVLIVEDDPMVMRLNADYLQRIPGVVIVARCLDVPRAQEVLEQEAVDLVLLDIYLRDRSGLEIVTWLRKRGREEDVILITAADEMDTVRAARRLGVSDYLVKPFTFERFRNAVQACAQSRTALASLPERVEQRDIDSLFNPPRRMASLRRDGLPKGLTPQTLAQVAEAVLSQGEAHFATEALNDATGMSRVSLRKYLKYLVEQGVLEEAFHYGQVGRPSFTYRCRDRQALEALTASS
ncbi:response regulator [Aidingimonas halophila]|uniref:Transcriptional regulatory protein n=1 Tax=Aidingimonas halophila TaxID=574349 RepID=A0A1H2V730_9GAMM|nr:response regulator [Aidingimonas halophila]GHC23879.1 two-component system response regulator DcuR [Aidingimonas halophila]SDW64133.1 two-component system, CitB family, response regulator/two-component system, CitB family, response regulator MalR [Aidingimonas halophila]